MGNQTGKKKSQPFVDIDEWQEVDEFKDSLFPQLNTYRTRLLFNTVTHDYIEEYMLHFVSEEDCLAYKGELEWRMFSNRSPSTHLPSAPPPHIYPARYFVQTSISELCTTTHSGSVYFEPVEMRLKEINDVPYQDSLFMIRACLDGFRLLFQKYGAFDILQDLIFVTREGSVRVWLNRNLSKNQHEQADSFSSEGEMILTLIRLVEDNIDPDDPLLLTKPKFSSYLLSRGGVGKRNFPLSFSRTQDIFNNFVEEQQLCVPSRMESVYQLYRNHRNQTSTSAAFDMGRVEDEVYSKPSSLRINQFEPESTVRSTSPKFGLWRQEGNILKEDDSSELKVTEMSQQQRMYMQLYKTSRIWDENRPKSSFEDNVSDARSSSNLITPNHRKSSHHDKYRVQTEYLVPEKGAASRITNRPRNPVRSKPSTPTITFTSGRVNETIKEPYNKQVVGHPRVPTLYKWQSSPQQRMCSADPRKVMSRLEWSPHKFGEPREMVRNVTPKVNFKYNSGESASPMLSEPKGAEPKRVENPFKYYTSNQSYELDSEIAKDLEKIYGIQM